MLITFDLPKQAATPMSGIQMVLRTEPKPVTVCKTEPSCNVNYMKDLNEGDNYYYYYY